MDKQSYLYKRVFMHKNDLIEGFTPQYKCHRLVYFEIFANVNTAIAREKQVKGWRREKKNKLVETMNPGWKDLAADWFPENLLLDGKPVQFKEASTRSLGPARALKKARARLTALGMTIIWILKVDSHAIPFEN